MLSSRELPYSFCKKFGVVANNSLATGELKLIHRKNTPLAAITEAQRLLGLVDEISLENINRQILALDCTLGQPKIEAAARRVRQINPHCRVEIVDLFVEKKSLEQVFTPRPDLLIDAIDTIGPKIELLAMAWNSSLRAQKSVSH